MTFLIDNPLNKKPRAIGIRHQVLAVFVGTDKTLFDLPEIAQICHLSWFRTAQVLEQLLNCNLIKVPPQMFIDGQAVQFQLSDQFLSGEVVWH